jgi:hypothetical protein
MGLKNVGKNLFETKKIVNMVYTIDEFKSKYKDKKVGLDVSGSFYNLVKTNLIHGNYEVICKKMEDLFQDFSDLTIVIDGSLSIQKSKETEIRFHSSNRYLTEAISNVYDLQEKIQNGKKISSNFWDTIHENFEKSCIIGSQKRELKINLE